MSHFFCDILRYCWSSHSSVCDIVIFQDIEGQRCCYHRILIPPVHRPLSFLSSNLFISIQLTSITGRFSDRSEFHYMVLLRKKFNFSFTLVGHLPIDPRIRPIWHNYINTSVNTVKMPSFMLILLSAIWLASLPKINVDQKWSLWISLVGVTPSQLWYK